MSFSDPWAKRLISALMLLYPRAFRREHGEGILQTYHDALRDAREEGRPQIRTWLWLVRDAVGCAIRTRITRRKRTRHNSERTVEDGWMGMVYGEVRLAWRALRRSPGFTLVVVMTMGLGIGANTAIFDVVYTVLLQPLPYEDADELVWLRNRYPALGSTGAISAGEFWEYRQNQPAFEGLVAFTGEVANLTGLQTPVQLEGLAVSPGYFELLGASPAVGRGFVPEEERPGTAPVTVISHGLWQAAFGSDPDIIGRQILLDGSSVTVVGVMGSDHAPLWGFLSPQERTDFWIPLVIDPSAFSSVTVEQHGWRVLGRLADSAGFESAEAGLLAAVRRVESTYPGISNEGERDVSVIALQQQVAGDTTGVLSLLSMAVGLVLLLACVNVTNLLVVRGEARASEVAVRAAIGAGRKRLLLHVFAESIIIGLLGGSVGVAVAIGGRGALFDILPQSVPVPVGAAGLGLPVLLSTLCLSLLAGALAGAIPGVRLVRGDVVTALKARGHEASPASGGQLLKRLLVVGQVAGAVTLVSGAGLMVRSLSQLRAVDPGFDRDDIQIVRINASSLTYNSLDQIRTLYETIESALEELPGVESATASWQTPLQSSMSDWPVMPEIGEERDWYGADPNFVTPAYFETYRIPLVAGRYFERSDLDRTDGPVVLNETAARLLFPGQQAVGRRVNLDFGSAIWRDVVGVVADIKGRGLGQVVRPQTYLTFAPGPFSGNPSLTLTVRSQLNTEQLRSSLIEVMAGIDPDIPIGAVVSMNQRVDSTLETERLLSVLLSMFGGIALLLGSIGVYGLMAYSVQRRRREIGLRIAMGAERSGVLGLVVRQGMTLGAVGVAVGLVGAVGAGRLLEGLLFGVTGTDVATLAVVSVAVLAVTGLSSFGPALRAASVDPMTTLRKQ